MISKWTVCKRGDRLRRGVPLKWRSCSDEDFIYHLFFMPASTRKVMHSQGSCCILTCFVWIDQWFTAVMLPVKFVALSILFMHNSSHHWDSNAPLFIIIRNMRTGGAARCIHVFRSTTIIKLGSIGWIIWSQLVVPLLIVVAAAYEEWGMKSARIWGIGRRRIELFAAFAYLLIPVFRFWSVFDAFAVAIPAAVHSFFLPANLLYFSLNFYFYCKLWEAAPAVFHYA